MIEAEREALLEGPLEPGAKGIAKRRRGAPLAMLMTVAMVWIAGRAVLWENPYPGETILDQAGALLLAVGPDGAEPSQAIVSFPVRTAAAPGSRSGQGVGVSPSTVSWGSDLGIVYDGERGDLAPAAQRRRAAGGHYKLWRAALTDDPRQVSWARSGNGFSSAAMRSDGRSASAPFLPDVTDRSENAGPGRWSLDAWAFWREGSDAAPISQGRVPVYGASQAGAILQYRFDPKGKRDPRAYVRAYRALVDRPETEVALGVSARPKASLPVRAAAELRVTENRFDTRIRPAAYAVTEIPPVALPLDFNAEVYAGAGYVAGEGDTLFIDGQANVTRRLVRFGPEGRDAVKVSLGAGAWGGAQRDADRLDVGPTMRVDLSVGDVPARFSIDWRERVSGDASPMSGLAATLSTSF